MKNSPLSNSDDIEATVIKVIAGIAGCDPDTLGRETRFRTDLGLDSLGLYELVIDMEEVFALQISDEDVDRFYTIGDVLTYLKHH